MQHWKPKFFCVLWSGKELWWVWVWNVFVLFFFRVCFPQCPTTLNKNSAASANSYLSLMKTCTVMNYPAPIVQDRESPHTSPMGHRENHSPYPETLQNFYSLLRKQDSGTAGDRNGRHMQFFSPSFLSLTVPGRCTWHKSKEWVVLPECGPCLEIWVVTGFRWICQMFEWDNNFYTHDILEKKFQNCQITIEKYFPVNKFWDFIYIIMTNFVSATNFIISLISPSFWSFMIMRKSTSSTKTLEWKYQWQAIYLPLQ